MNRTDRRRRKKLATKGRFKPGDDLTPALKQAADWHRAGRLVQAAGIYQRVLAADPDQADVLHLLATIVYEQGDAKRAVELSRRAVAQAAANPDYLNMLGTALLALGRLPEAETSFRQAIAAAPGGAESHSNFLAGAAPAGAFVRGRGIARAGPGTGSGVDQDPQQPGRYAPRPGQARGRCGDLRPGAGARSGLCRGPQQSGAGPARAW